MALAVLNTRTGNALCIVDTRKDLRNYCERLMSRGVFTVHLRGFLCGTCYHGVYDTEVLSDRLKEELERSER